MHKARRYCQGAYGCYEENDTLFKKNIGITQPKEAPRRPNRTEADETTFLYPSSVMNNYFFTNNMGFSAGNRLQKTLTTDKTVTPSSNLSIISLPQYISANLTRNSRNSTNESLK